MRPLVDVGRRIREGFFMFWETLWPLILGFGLSGAVQAFVSREQMERTMGDHRPPAVVRASAWGTVSSSCSYAATAMAKSLFQNGADFTTAMIFMFASTNLVLELGIVVLLGWPFAVAEFIGGLIMIALLALTGSIVVARPLAERARRCLQERGPGGGHDHDAMAGVSFVCSVGNVPLAAALWHGGISLGGVIASVFADLVTSRCSSSTGSTTARG